MGEKPDDDEIIQRTWDLIAWLLEKLNQTGGKT